MAARTGVLPTPWRMAAACSGKMPGQRGDAQRVRQRVTARGAVVSGELWRATVSPPADPEAYSARRVLRLAEDY